MICQIFVINWSQFRNYSSITTCLKKIARIILELS